MGRAIVLVLGLLSIAHVCNGGDRGKKRLPMIEEMMAQSSLLRLQEEEYSRFVNKGPRPYHCFVLAAPYSDPSYAPVKNLIQLLADISVSYEVVLRERRETEPAALREMVFVIVDTTHFPELFKQIIHMDHHLTQHDHHLLLFDTQHGVEGPVALYWLPPIAEKRTEFVELSSENLYNFRQAIKSSAIHEWVQQQTDIEFAMYETWFQQMIPYGSLLMGIVLMGYVIKAAAPYAMDPTTRLNFCFGCCCLVIVCVFSGFHYCVLREVPPFGFDSRTNRMLLFHPNPSQQYALEGIVVVAVQCFAAILFVALIQIYPKTPNDEDKSIVGAMLCGMLFVTLAFLRYLFFGKQRWPFF